MCSRSRARRSVSRSNPATAGSTMRQVSQRLPWPQAGSGLRRESEAEEGAQAREVVVEDGPAPGHALVEDGELAAADGGGDVAQAAVVADLRVLVVEHGLAPAWRAPAPGRSPPPSGRAACRRTAMLDFKT